MSHQLPELPTEVKQFINNTPMVQSLLYNLNLLPELIEQSSDMQKMLTIVEHMKAFSELIPIASVKREPLSFEQLSTIWCGLSKRGFIRDSLSYAFARAIEQAHGITATTASRDGE